MLTALLTLTVLSAAPASGLTVSVQIGKPNTPVEVFLDAIEQECVAAKLPVKRLTLSCAGERECLVKGAQASGVPGLVAVSLAYAKKEATVDLEALRTSDGVTVSQLTFSVTGRLTDADREAVRKFAARVVEALTPAVADAPVRDPKKDPVLVPEPKKDEPQVSLTTPVTPRSRVPVYVLGGGAVATGVVSGALLAVASAHHGDLQNAPDFKYTKSEATALVQQTNGEYTAALATGIAAGALATAAIIWLLAD